MGKTLTPNFSVGFTPSAVKMEHNKAAGVDYLHKKFQPPSSNRYGNINDQNFENLTPNFGAKLARSAPKMEHNKVRMENYLQ